MATKAVVKKIPNSINGIRVKKDKEWKMDNGDKMITVRPVCEDDMNLWEYRVKDGLLLHMIDGEENIIH
jgi:hypothetical protein